MKGGNDWHSQLAEERQNMPARWSAENAELVLQANYIYVADVQEIRRTQIRGQVLLVNFESNYLRVLITILDVIN